MRTIRRIIAIIALILAAMTEITPNIIAFITENTTTQKIVVGICSGIFLILFIAEIIDQRKKDKKIGKLENTLKAEKEATNEIRKFDTFKRLNQFPQGDYSINGELTIFEPHWRILVYKTYSIQEINGLIKHGALHESEVLIPIEGKKDDYTEYKKNHEFNEA